jgi:hypothetical protein
VKTNTKRPKREREQRLTLFRWLVGFAAVELDNQPRGQVEAVPDRVLAAAQIAGGVWPASLVTERVRPARGSRRHRRGGARFSSSDGMYMTEWAARDTSRFHRQLQGLLNTLFPTFAQDDHEPTVATAYVPARLRSLCLQNDGRTIRRVYVSDDSNPTWFGIAALIEEFGSLLRRCSVPGCETIFVRNRRQEYCTGQCSQNVRSATWYKKHKPAAKAARRARYLRSIRQARPKGKVGPYRRRDEQR